MTSNTITKKYITATTFTPQYDQIEDRVRVTLNYNTYNTRVDFVLSRNMILQFLPILNQYIDTYYKEFLADEKIDTFEDELLELTQPKVTLKQANKKLDKSTQPKQLALTDNSDLELLKKEDQLLIKIDMTYNTDTKSTTLQLHSNETLVKAILDKNSFLNIIKTIKQTIPTYKWGISPRFIKM